MKNTVWILLLLVSVPLYAQTQSLMDAFGKHQESIEPDSSSGSGALRKKPKEVVQTNSSSNSVADLKCDEIEQTSLPLKYLSNLIQTPEGKLDVNHDPRKGILEVTVPKMIGNCNSMLEWKFKDQTIDGERVYSVELKIKEGENCVDGLCEYSFELFDNGIKQAQPIKKFKPSVSGFEECLKSANVIEGGNVRKGAIYSAPVIGRFTDVYDSGKIQFVSHGPNSVMVGPKHGMSKINKCDYYEEISGSADKQSLVSLSEIESKRIAAEKEELKKCSINEYYKVADFIEKYQSSAEDMVSIRDDLIKKAAIGAAKNFDKNQFSEEDLKIVDDFDRYIVQPQVSKVKRLYKELVNAQGAEADAKKAELALEMKELKKLNAKPYFEAAHTEKMLDKGRFEEADKLNTMKLTINAFSMLGSNNGRMTPDAAVAKINNERRTFLNYVDTAREKYELKTGQLTGKEEYYRNYAKSMRTNIQIRTANYTEEIQAEYMRTQQGGYCYAYFRNTQKCIQDSFERSQELQAIMKHHNRIDEERAQEYDEKSAAYGKLEAEGRRYIAAQNGDEAPAETPTESTRPEDSTHPPKRDSGSYSFDYPGGGAQQGQPQQPQMMGQNPLAGWQAGGYQQQGYNPFQQMGQMGFPQMGYQQQPFMGQQAYNGFGGYGGYGGMTNMGGNYSFMYGGTGGMQQQQMGYGMQGGYGIQGQQGFWGQPYGAYNMNSMYGR